MSSLSGHALPKVHVSQEEDPEIVADVDVLWILCHPEHPVWIYATVLGCEAHCTCLQAQDLTCKACKH